MAFALPVLREASITQGPIAVERVSPRSVRISVTDRCDMACIYCRPVTGDGYLSPEDRLGAEEWERLLRGLVASGVRRVRITGGEPLLLRGLVSLVARIAALGIDDLALTTNGSQLARLARPLRDAGLRRINVSLDSLDPERFARITRGGRLSQVLAGIDAALECGFEQVKTNTVVLRGENDDELEAIVQWAWARKITPRFLEVMGVGEGARIYRERLVPYTEMRARLAHLLEPGDVPTTEPDRGPAKYVRGRDGLGRVGFITGTSEVFCAGCDRLRVTSDGVLRPCLSRNDGVDAGEVLRRGGGENEVRAALASAWAMKPADDWGGCTEESASLVSMCATGG